MHFDLGNHIRSRSRSSQLEKTLASVAAIGSMSLTDGKRSMRTVSAPRPSGPLTENTNLVNVGGSLQGSLRGSLRGLPNEMLRGSGAVVHFDEELPKLVPVQPLTYDELYTNTPPKKEMLGDNENTDVAKDEVAAEEDDDEAIEPAFLIC